MTIPLLLFRETWSHMAAISGFDPLFDEIERAAPGRSHSFRAPRRSAVSQALQQVLVRLRGKASAEHSPGVEPWRGPWVCSQARRFKNAWILLASGEAHLSRRLLAQSDLSKRVIYFAHQPPGWYRLHWRNIECFRQIGGIVTLCSAQTKFFQGVSEAPILQIKHGVATDFFTPADEERDSVPRLIFVGQWLRDFEILEVAMRQVWRRFPICRLDCVVPHDARERSTALLRLASRSEVTFHAGISPEALRSLYRRASLTFLPVIDSTANNALLESLSCGRAVVSTAIGGCPEYVPSECGLLAEASNADDHAAKVIQLLEDTSLRASMEGNARRHALTEFLWTPDGAAVLRWIGQLENRDRPSRDISHL